MSRWWSGFFFGMATQYAVLLYLAIPPLHRQWWAPLYWLGCSLVCALAAAGWRLRVLRSHEKAES